MISQIYKESEKITKDILLYMSLSVHVNFIIKVKTSFLKGMLKFLII